MRSEALDVVPGGFFARVRGHWIFRAAPSCYQRGSGLAIARSAPMSLRSIDMPSSNLLSIGALSRATGVPADTLRTWERRYGFPAAERTESGHRRYSLLTLERLRLMVRAL